MLSPTTVIPPGSLLIGDRWVNDSTAGTTPHINPATGTAQAEVVLAGEAEVDAAVAAARQASHTWKNTSPVERRQALLRLADLFEAHRGEFATLGMLENGTPIAFADLVCAAVPADWFRYYAGWADKLEGRVIPTWPGDVLDYTRVEPYGVVAVLSAFNVPTFFIGSKVAPALAAGNTVVLKPSPLAPFTSLRFAEICLEAGLPPGVVNVITGDATAGAALAGHPDIDKITFTGGKEAAKAVIAASAEHLTPVTLELGGKSASIIFADADLDQAITASTQLVFALLSGQACLAGSRLLAQRDVYDEVVETVVDLARSLIVGDPTDPSTLLGPLISQFHCDRVLSVIDRARSERAGTLATGGNRLDGELAAGYYIEPTVFTDVDPTSELAREEIFGPVLSILPFDTVDDAVALANATTYGLAGYVFTRDLGNAHKVAHHLDAGYVCVNTMSYLPPSAPFGGVKDSGFGREGGQEGIQEMTRTKNVYVLLD